MTAIHIAHDVPVEVVEQIRQHLAHVALHDSNFNGVDFRILRDDYTFIADDERGDAGRLLNEIQAIIAGEDEG